MLVLVYDASVCDCETNDSDDSLLIACVDYMV